MIDCIAIASYQLSQYTFYNACCSAKSMASFIPKFNISKKFAACGIQLHKVQLASYDMSEIAKSMYKSDPDHKIHLVVLSNFPYTNM